MAPRTGRILARYTEDYTLYQHDSFTFKIDRDYRHGYTQD